jgi:hypothetical protein
MSGDFGCERAVPVLAEARMDALKPVQPARRYQEMSGRSLCPQHCLKAGTVGYRPKRRKVRALRWREQRAAHAMIWREWAAQHRLLADLVRNKKISDQAPRVCNCP